MIFRRIVSTFGADHVNRHRVPGDSPVVSGLHDITIMRTITLFRAGIPPINAISDGLQGQPMKNRDPCAPLIMMHYCEIQ